MANETPLFRHDCPLCEFQGHVGGKDWYVCPTTVGRPALDSIIGRFGNEPQAYYSTHPREAITGSESSQTEETIAQSLYESYRAQRAARGFVVTRFTRMR